MIDYKRYLDVCQIASISENVFNGFKRNPNYTWVLEHVSHSQGADYYNQIKEAGGVVFDNLKIFEKNDALGNPYQFEYGGAVLSPTTMRYIKVLSDLVCLFGGLDYLNIVEIGVGYGGQCKLINDLFKPSSYTLVDLPEVLSLSDKYLSKCNVPHTLRNATDASIIKYDLCISNYAFTEISREYQDFYADYIIKYSDSGYITCNFFGQRGGDGAMSKEDIFSLKSNYTLLPEKPLTAPQNIIYTWSSQAR